MPEPKCKKCGKQETPLFSVNEPGEMIGVAVCKECGNICTKCERQKCNCRK